MPLTEVETLIGSTCLAEKMLGVLRLKDLWHPGESGLCAVWYICNESRGKDEIEFIDFFQFYRIYSSHFYIYDLLDLKDIFRPKRSYIYTYIYMI